MPETLRRAIAALLLLLAFSDARAALASAATTGGVVEITANTATVLARVSAGGSRTVIVFDFATTVNDARVAVATPSSLGAGTSSAVIAPISGLACGTTYYYRVRTINAAGVTINGSPLDFRTGDCAPGPPPPPPGPPATSLECSPATVLCVGAGQEYSTIQAAVDAAQPGDTVLVFDGNYAGFVVTRSGTPSAYISVRARSGAVVIDRASAAGEAVRVNNSSYVAIEGFTIQNVSGFGLAARGATPATPMHGIVFRDNIVRNCGASALDANIYASEVADSLIEGNTSTGSKGHGIYLANAGSKNTTIRGNVVGGNGGAGIHFNGDDSVGGDGLQSGLLVEDNLVYDSVDNGLNLDGVQFSVFRNNVVYNGGHHTFRAYQSDAAAGPRGLVIVNNTFVVNASISNTGIKLTQDSGGHTIFNNVIANAGPGGSIIVDNAAFRSDHNTFVNPSFSLDGGNTGMTLAQWRAQSGTYDGASLAATQDALFLSSGARDYRLRAGSPAANAGLASFNGITAPALDILGVARPQGSAHDQGAYESF